MFESVAALKKEAGNREMNASAARVARERDL